MRIMVTGGSGFLGGHLVRHAVEEGHEAVIFDIVEPPFDYDPNKVLFVKGDIRNFDVEILEKYQPDAVAHFAGLLGTMEQMEDPTPSIDVNIHGTVNFLKALREYRTIPCIQSNNGRGFRLSTYPITRGTAARFACMFNQDFGTRVAVARLMNAYGEWQKTEPIRKIIPSFAVRGWSNKPLEIFGDGKQIVDLVYAGDIAKASLKCLDEDFDMYDKILEIGSGVPITVNEVADLVIEMTGNTAGKKYLPMRLGEPEGNVAVVREPELLKLSTGYLPDTELESGLEKTLYWYKEHYSL